MRTSTTFAVWTVRILGLFQVVLGILFWTRNALALIPVHMITGTILILALWFLSFQVIQTGANPTLGYFSILWGVLTVALGMFQAQILPGPFHWVIQVLHLLVGVGAMGLADSANRSMLEDQAMVR